MALGSLVSMGAVQNRRSQPIPNENVLILVWATDEFYRTYLSLMVLSIDTTKSRRNVPERLANGNAFALLLKRVWKSRFYTVIDPGALRKPVTSRFFPSNRALIRRCWVNQLFPYSTGFRSLLATSRSNRFLLLHLSNQQTTGGTGAIHPPSKPHRKEMSAPTHLPQTPWLASPPPPPLPPHHTSPSPQHPATHPP